MSVIRRGVKLNVRSRDVTGFAFALRRIQKAPTILHLRRRDAHEQIFKRPGATRWTRNNVGAYSAAWDRALAQRIPRVSLTRAVITKITLPIRRTLPPPPQPPSLPPPPLAGKLDQRLWYAWNFAAEHTFGERAFPPGASLSPPLLGPPPSHCYSAADLDRRPLNPPQIRCRCGVSLLFARCIFRRGPW